MLSIEILAVGRFRKAGCHKELWDEYRKQISWPLKLFELDAQTTSDEHKKILEKLSPQAYVIALDERGKSPRSLEFSKNIQKLQDTGVQVQVSKNFNLYLAARMA